jgi:hypothetical protein
MQVIINSPHYCVLELMSDAEGHSVGIEIVDKSTRKEMFLVGNAADHFKLEMEKLAATDPSEEDVEAFLDNYRPWMHQSVMIH